MGGQDRADITLTKGSSGGVIATITAADRSLLKRAAAAQATKVSLSGPAVTPEMVERLDHLAGQLVGVGLYPSVDSAPAEAVLAALESVADIKDLSLRPEGRYEVAPAALRRLARLRRLWSLSITGTAGLGPGLDVLADLPKLRWLTLRYSLTDVKELHLVADAKQIEHLDPSYSDIRYDDLWPLTGHPNLRGIFTYGLLHPPAAKATEFHRMLLGLSSLNDYQGASLSTVVRWRLRRRGVRVSETNTFERGRGGWEVVG